ncbi:hypothetical protein VST63_09725 [Mycolicibacterium sp. 050232]|uniref:hypothetical protein n=1 Tax=Mycolicibacterium sp. 050232 TaxID=3113982 RepID=UPI002E2D0731|nr:hypothetical protein [Mycolicibacterium sp. 050232]MED5812641.1 hypothetical protein [Mycolicibacterium sp. 050232]
MVETLAEFVWACALLGYQHPDLTLHAGQVHDWYATEDGLDLRMLDADCAALTAAAGAAEQALRLHDEQLTALEQAWQGRGARAAREFLRRHGGAAGQAGAAVRGAADTLASLRDQLWRAVDTKVAVTEDIEARCAAQRQDWLAAARTVRTGIGDRALAGELIDAQVKPFVANDIGADWVPAMRSAKAAVSDAYAAAIAALSDRPAPVFEIPGDLGPSWTPRIGAAVSADLPVGGARTMPAEFVPSAGTGSAPWVSPVGATNSASLPQLPATAPNFTPPTIGSAAVPDSAVGPATGPTAADPTAGWGSTLGGGGLPGAGLSGAGLSGMGSGASGLGRQLADLFGGLIGSADGSLGSSADTALPGQLDPPEGSAPVDELDDADDADDLDEPDDEDVDAAAEDSAAEEDNNAEEESTAPEAEEVSTDVPGPADTTVDTAAEPQPVAAAPGVAVPLAEDPVAPAGETPCAIAADELPQVGG